MLVSLQSFALLLLTKVRLPVVLLFVFKIRWGKHYMKSVAFDANLIT